MESKVISFISTYYISEKDAEWNLNTCEVLWKHFLP